MPSIFNTFLLSLLGGVLPALVWLWFWLKEDRLHPEPKARLSLVFIMGMASVFLVLPIEKTVFKLLGGSIGLMTVLSWAATEEMFKYLAAYFSALKGKDMDEPLDAVIYMITAALGFSAIENALFISNLIDVGLFGESIITGNSRFSGATLLHIASSASVGIMVGLAYFKSNLWKRIFLFTGLAASIVLHTVFNLLIIELRNDIFMVFAGVWVLVILLLVLIEKVKQTHS